MLQEPIVSCIKLQSFELNSPTVHIFLGHSLGRGKYLEIGVTNTI